MGEDATTTGASSDVQQVASIAKRMCTEWGMNDRIGAIYMEEGSMFQPSPWGSNKMLEEEEVEILVNNSYMTAKKIILENRPLFEELTQELMEREVVSAEEFQMMLVKYDSKVIDYGLIGKERNRDKLSFQELNNRL